MLTLLSGARSKCMHALVFIGARGGKQGAAPSRATSGQAERLEAKPGGARRRPGGLGCRVVGGEGT